MGKIVPEDSIDEFFNDSSAIHSFLLQALLVEEDYLVFLSQITCHTGLESILEFIAPSDCNDEILIHLLLKEQRPIVVLFVFLHEFLQFAHTGLEGKDKWQLSK